MIIAPLVFATVVAGITGTGDAKEMGRIGLKALLWFITASLVSLLLGMVLANFFQPGANLKLPLPDAGLSTDLKTGGLGLREFIVHVFPRSFFESMATNEILQILVFSLFFGFALAALKDKPATTIVSFINELAHAMLKLTEYVMLFAPLFIAQAYGIELSVGQQVTLLLVMMLSSKGVAGVPRASLVVVAAVLPTFGLPEAGLLLIMGIDQFLDMGRTATNVIGNGIATAVVAKWN